MCLLSLVIPTKNRQYTALYAVKSLLDLPMDDAEVIVHDCSDTDELRGMLLKQFGSDPRVKYHYIDSPISMTKNWNLAFQKAAGTYVCGIGDDDAVMPAIVDVVRWMDSVQADALLPLRISYVWTDAYVGEISCGRVTFPSRFDGSVRQVDLEAELRIKSRDCGFGYDYELPNVYHGLIRNDILRQHEKEVGAIFRGTSLDAYAPFAFAKYTKKVYYLDYPVTIRGICGKSNSNRIVSKKSILHFKEYDSKSLSLPEYLPPILNSDVSITESCIIGLKDAGRDDLIDLMDLSVIYGKCAANEPWLLPLLFKRLLRYKTPSTDTARFFSVFFSYLLGRTLKLGFLSSFLGFVNRFVPVYDFICGTLIKRNQKIKSGDISEAIQKVDAYAKTNGVVMQTAPKPFKTVTIVGASE